MDATENEGIQVSTAIYKILLIWAGTAMAIVNISFAAGVETLYVLRLRKYNDDSKVLRLLDRVARAIADEYEQLLTDDER